MCHHFQANTLVLWAEVLMTVAHVTITDPRPADNFLAITSNHSNKVVPSRTVRKQVSESVLEFLSVLPIAKQSASCIDVRSL